MLDPVVGGLPFMVCRCPQDGRSAAKGGCLLSASRATVHAWEGFCLLMELGRNGANLSVSYSVVSASVHMEDVGGSSPENVLDVAYWLAKVVSDSGKIHATSGRSPGG